MIFPKPELNVCRWQVFVWYQPGRTWGVPSNHRTLEIAKRHMDVRLVPAYIYDRHEGEVCATNEEKLKYGG